MAEDTGSTSIVVKNIHHDVDDADLPAIFHVYDGPINVSYVRSQHSRFDGVAIVDYETSQIAFSTAKHFDDRRQPEINHGVAFLVEQSQLFSQDNLTTLQQQLRLQPRPPPRYDLRPRHPPQGPQSVNPAEPAPENQEPSTGSCIVTIKNLGQSVTTAELVQGFSLDGRPVTVYSHAPERTTATARLIYHTPDAARWIAYNFHGRRWPDQRSLALSVRHH
nr:hypothetical protein CFP56_01361 [Quercus suber]